MRKKTRLFIIMSVSVVALTVAYFMIESSLRPSLIAMGEAQITNSATQILQSAIADTLADYDSSQDFLYIEKDTDGRVSLVSPDSIAINNIAVNTALFAQKELNTLEESHISIPLASAMGINLLTNTGPYIPVIIDNVGAVEPVFNTEFSEAGINQTRYRVHLTLTANMSMLIGASPHPVSVTAHAVIAESIIVGDVPATYANLPANDEFLNLLPDA